MKAWKWIVIALVAVLVVVVSGSYLVPSTFKIANLFESTGPSAPGST